MRRIVHRVAAAEDSPGVTLVDVLIVLGTLSLIMGAVSAVYVAGTRVYYKASHLSDRQEQVRTALNYMIRDVRELGYDPSGAVTALGLTTPLLTAEAGTLEFLGGVMRDGVTTYKVKYAHSTAGNVCSLGCITRQIAQWNGASNNFDGYGPAMPIATTVGELSFTYYDNAGPPNNSLTSLPLSAANRAKVKRIVIQIRGAEDPGNPQVALSSSIRPRNL